MSVVFNLRIPSSGVLNILNFLNNWHNELISKQSGPFFLYRSEDNSININFNLSVLTSGMCYTVLYSINNNAGNSRRNSNRIFRDWFIGTSIFFSTFLIDSKNLKSIMCIVLIGSFLSSPLKIRWNQRQAYTYQL